MFIANLNHILHVVLFPLLTLIKYISVDFEQVDVGWAHLELQLKQT